ncbi:hypothetical protein TNIN_137751 [Trichonephila inaurata madagascariensis]|uniref:Uncharacterized protein n=1 Tax=Trichonephila inaurata madagascariensis TaxID=2747483 RepID=A0A8X6XGP3_9ARAC|nr:hypothetical protein TNIN_137751 [Trichonephila inaurata madagascariensis]
MTHKLSFTVTDNHLIYIYYLYHQISPNTKRPVLDYPGSGHSQEKPFVEALEYWYPLEYVPLVHDFSRPASVEHASKTASRECPPRMLGRVFQAFARFRCKELPKNVKGSTDADDVS